VHSPVVPRGEFGAAQSPASAGKGSAGAVPGPLGFAPARRQRSNRRDSDGIPCQPDSLRALVSRDGSPILYSVERLRRGDRSPTLWLLVWADRRTCPLGGQCPLPADGQSVTTSGDVVVEIAERPRRRPSVGVWVHLLRVHSEPCIRRYAPAGGRSPRASRRAPCAPCRSPIRSAASGGTRLMPQSIAPHICGSSEMSLDARRRRPRMWDGMLGGWLWAWSPSPL
jgi:hypothetical protein